MGAFVFTLREAPPERVDLSALVPERLAALTAGEVERLVIGGGRRRPIHVGDLFGVAPGPDESVVIEGGHERLDRIGAGLGGGLIRVEGDVGQRLGEGMLAGTIRVFGHAGPLAGAGMAGGTLRIAGNAGDRVGGALDGRISGMRGGLIAIGGAAGDRVGDRMRRGTIVARTAGAFAGARMIAGTIVAGSVGRQPGFLMRRGSLVVGTVEGGPLPTFLDCGALELSFLGLLGRSLANLDLPWQPHVPPIVRRFQGDQGSLGKGELLVAL